MFSEFLVFFFFYFLVLNDHNFMFVAGVMFLIETAKLHEFCNLHSVEILILLLYVILHLHR